MKFEELEEKALWLGRNFAKQYIPGTNIKVAWILPVPIDAHLKDVFKRCFYAKVPFVEYFKNFVGHQSEVNVIGMDGDFYPLHEICPGFDYLCNLTSKGVIDATTIKYKVEGELTGICREHTKYNAGIDEEWEQCLIIQSITIFTFLQGDGKIEFDTQIKLRYDRDKRSLDYYTELCELTDLEINTLLHKEIQNASETLKITPIKVSDLIKRLDPFLQ